MRHQPRSFRLALGAVCAGLTLLLTGCGTSTPPAAHAEARTSFDQTLHDLLPAAVRERGVLRVATDGSYPPMSSFAADGRNIIGMEPDLGADLGRVLGVRVKFVRWNFSDIVTDVAAHKVDAGMSAITDTPERAKLVDFVNYFSAGTAILVQRGNPAGITDIGDLCGRVVAVEEGTTQVDLLDRAQGNCQHRVVVKTYPTNSDALMQLRTGRVVAVLNDLPPAAFLVTNSRTRSHYQLASSTQYEPGLYGIAVAKDNHGVRDAVQRACVQLLRSGVYADVLAKWGVQDGAVEEISINSASRR